MQKRFMTFGMVLFFSLSFWSCPAWSGEGSAIMAAILENDPSALQEALQSGVRLDVTDSHGHTPLDMALAHGNAFSAPGMVELLLRHGARPGPGLADPALTLARLLATQAPLSQLEAALQAGGKADSTMPNGFTAFLWAAALCPNPAVLEALVKAGANPRQVLPGGDARLGDNALLLAAEYNRNPEIIRFLLRSGLDVNSRSSLLGDSALMVACRANKNPAVAETLIRHGADVNIRNGVACSGQSGLSSVRFLLSVGLPVNGRSGQDFGAYSPLMLAVRNDAPDADVIRLLLQHGADPSLRDLDGKRAGDELSVERIIWLKQNGLAEIL